VLFRREPQLRKDYSRFRERWAEYLPWLMQIHGGGVCDLSGRASAQGDLVREYFGELRLYQSETILLSKFSRLVLQKVVKHGLQRVHRSLKLQNSVVEGWGRCSSEPSHFRDALQHNDNFDVNENNGNRWASPLDILTSCGWSIRISSAWVDDRGAHRQGSQACRIRFAGRSEDITENESSLIHTL
jgi:hypothetical protein